MGGNNDVDDTKAALKTIDRKTGPVAALNRRMNMGSESRAPLEEKTRQALRVFDLRHPVRSPFARPSPSLSLSLRCVFSGQSPVPPPASLTLGESPIFNIPPGRFHSSVHHPLAASLSSPIFYGGPSLHLPLSGSLSLPDLTAISFLPSLPSQFSKACPDLSLLVTLSSGLSLFLSDPPLSPSLSSQFSLYLPDVERDSSGENTRQRLLPGTISLAAVSNVRIPEQFTQSGMFQDYFQHVSTSQVFELLSFFSQFCSLECFKRVTHMSEIQEQLKNKINGERVKRKRKVPTVICRYLGNQSSRHKFITGSIKDGRKRGRNDNFDMAWKAMFQSRWPGPVRQIQPTGCTAGQVGKTRHELKECLDWQQMYWEAHLQDCLDAAAEIALLPYFGGPIGETSEAWKCASNSENRNQGNNLSKDDTEDLKSALVYAPNLRKLDISDNLIGDDGIRNLIPYFIGAFGRALPISDLRLENCNLSYNGAAELLMSLSTSKNPLLALSIADNNLGSDVAVPLAKFLETSHVRMLNVEDIDLGSSGFLELCKKIPEELELMHINLSKNRGGIEAAKFVHKLILHAPRLGVVNAGYNFMPEESCAILCDALKLSKGQLERLDLTGNIRCCQSTHVSMLQEFHSQGRPIVILQSFSASTAPYDDDP
ncbi:hypothetical protein ACLOJK_011168 [Asimina triloba]